MSKPIWRPSMRFVDLYCSRTGRQDRAAAHRMLRYPKTLLEVDIIEECREWLVQSSFSFRTLTDMLVEVPILWFSPDFFLTLDEHKAKLVNFENFLRLGNSSAFWGEVFVCVKKGAGEPTAEWKLIFQLLSKQPFSHSLPGEIMLLHGVVQEQEPDYDPDGIDEHVIPEVPDRACPLSGETLAYLLDSCSSNVESLEFHDMEFNLEQCQKLAAFRGSLCFRCQGKFEDDGRSILNAIASGQGPQKLSLMGMKVDRLALQNAIRCSSSLRELSLHEEYRFYHDVPFRELFSAIQLNQSLEKLKIGSNSYRRDELGIARNENITLVEDEWIFAIQSLSKHPTLETFEFNAKPRKVPFPLGAEESERERISALQREAPKRLAREVLTLLGDNTVLYELNFPNKLLDKKILGNDIRPRLRRNKYLWSIARESEERVRCKLVATALCDGELNRDPNLMFAFASKFHEYVSLMQTGSLEGPMDRVLESPNEQEGGSE